MASTALVTSCSRAVWARQSTRGSATARTQPSTRSGSATRSDTRRSSGCGQGSGLDIQALLPLLAAFLPQIIDMLTPDGQAPYGRPERRAREQWPGDLGGLLGGLLGGATTGGASGTGSLDDLLGGLGGMLGGDKGR